MTSAIHDYTPILGNACLPRRSLALERHVFEGPAQDSLPFDTIVSSSSKPPYWSPAALNLGAPAADAALLRFVRRHNVLHAACESAWKGWWCDSRHSLVFKVLPSALEPTGWMIALGHYDGGSRLCWPASVGSHPLAPGLKWVRPLPISEPCFVNIMAFEQVEAFSIRWRPHSWQRKHLLAEVMRGSRPSIRCFQATEPAPLLTVMAKAAFWKATKSTLTDMAKHLCSDCVARS